jgi:hypothetical protein
MKKKLENGKRRKMGKNNGLDILGLGRLRLPNQGIEFFPYPDFLILRFIGRLANYTPPEIIVYFFHILKKINPPWKKQIRLHGDFFLEALKKRKINGICY